MPGTVPAWPRTRSRGSRRGTERSKPRKSGKNSAATTAAAVDEAADGPGGYPADDRGGGPRGRRRRAGRPRGHARRPPRRAPARAGDRSVGGTGRGGRAARDAHRRGHPCRGRPDRHPRALRPCRAARRVRRARSRAPAPGSCRPPSWPSWPQAIPPAGGALANGRWWPVVTLGTPGGPAMAFDHLDIVTAGVERLRDGARAQRRRHRRLGGPAVHTRRPPPASTDAAWGEEPRAGQLPAQGAGETPGFVRPTSGTRTVGTGRPADLYVRGSGAVLHPPMPQPTLRHSGTSASDDGPVSGQQDADRLRAGFPATTAPGGTSRVTTEPAPTTASAPTVTPGSTTTPPPSHRVVADDKTGEANLPLGPAQSGVDRMAGGEQLHVRPDLGRRRRWSRRRRPGRRGRSSRTSGRRS